MQRLQKASLAPAESIILPTPESIRSYDMFFDMPIELPDIKQKGVQGVSVTRTPEDTPIVPRKSAQSLFNLPNHGIERFVNNTPLRRRASCHSDSSFTSTEIGTSSVEAAAASLREVDTKVLCASNRLVCNLSIQRFPVEVNNHHPSFPGGRRERNLPRQFGNSGIEASSVELKVLSPRIKALKTPMEFGQPSINLPSTGSERYSLEVHPPTVS